MDETKVEERVRGSWIHALAQMCRPTSMLLLARVALSTRTCSARIRQAEHQIPPQLIKIALNPAALTISLRKAR